MENLLKNPHTEPQSFCRTLGAKPSFSDPANSPPKFGIKTLQGNFTLQRRHPNLNELELLKGTTHLDPLLGAGFGASVPVFIFLIFFLFKVPVWTLQCRFCLLSAGFVASSAGLAEKMEKEKSEYLGKPLRAVP